MAPTSLDLTIADSDQRLRLTDARLVVAGYTAREQSIVQAHIDELAAIGVTPPSAIPMFYELDPALLTTAPAIEVTGSKTSGELEPVVVRSHGRLYLGLGSDHTDREMEVEDVARSKAAAPKPLGPSVVPLADVADRWDDITVSCRVDHQLYQDGRLAVMLSPQELLAKLAKLELEPVADMVLYCGTLPLLSGGFIHGVSYEMELHVPDGPTLRHSYTVQTKTGSVSES